MSSQAPALRIRNPERVELIPISLLRQSRYQIRDEAFESRSGLEDLANSIKTIGLLELPRVRECPDDQGCFELISGHRRVRAVSECLGWKEIKCLVCEDIDEITTFRLGLAENVQRNNLSAYEEGVAYLLCQKLFGFSDDQILELFNRSRTTIASRRDLAKATNEYLKFVPSSQATRFMQNFTLGHRDVLAKLEDKEAIGRVTQIIARGTSVRNLQRYIDLLGYTDKSRFKSKATHLGNLSQNEILKATIETVKELQKDIPAPFRFKVSKLTSSLKNTFCTMGESGQQQQFLNMFSLIGGEKVTDEDISKFLYDIPLGFHSVLLYEEPYLGEMLSLLYLSHGLIKGEDAVYATQEDPDKVRKSMVEHGLDVKHYETERKSLHIRRVTDPSKHPESLDETMREMYNQIFEGVKRPCRLVGSPIPEIGTEIQRRSNIDLERKVQSAFEGEGTQRIPYSLFRDFEGSVMCRYCVSRNGSSCLISWIKDIVSNHHVSIFVAGQAEGQLLLKAFR